MKSRKVAPATYNFVVADITIGQVHSIDAVYVDGVSVAEHAVPPTFNSDQALVQVHGSIIAPTREETVGTRQPIRLTENGDSTMPGRTAIEWSRRVWNAIIRRRSLARISGGSR